MIAWLWARTVASSNPACRGAHVPLVSSFMLSTKAGKEAWVEPVLDPATRAGYRFEVRTGKANPSTLAQAKTGTKSSRGAHFVCVLTGAAITPAYIRTEGKAKRMGARLMAIVAEGKRGRVYLPPDEENERIAASAEPTWVPEGDMPKNPRWFSPPDYGMPAFADLFTPRQLVSLTTFSDLVLEARAKALEDAKAAGMDPDPFPLADSGTGAQAYADALAVYLAFAVDRSADAWSSIATWSAQPKNELVIFTFRRHALPMTWDFGEVNPFSSSGGNFYGNLSAGATTVERATAPFAGAKIEIADASSGMNNREVTVCTDPPYYDNIGYADLSDYFYVWLRRMIYDFYPKILATMLVPKTRELVATPYRFQGGQLEAERFFIGGMSRAIRSMAQVLMTQSPVVIYYAFKQSEVEAEGLISTGWATFLEAVIAAGFQVDGTWPVRTERGGRTISIGSNALASSIVLVCRKRPEGAASVTRGEFLRALRAELPGALRTLQESAIAPVDMAQASIGPGMAVFSRYRAVLEADDRPMSVREALRIINAELDEYLARQEGDYDRWTRFAVTWFGQHQFNTGKYGEAETLAKARDVAVQGVVVAGIFEAKGGKARLLKREELPDDYVPFEDHRQTVWEGCQHLIKRLQGGGEEEAARLAKQLGYQAEMARDLAHRLFQICERNKWAEEARAYNALGSSWREITKIAGTLPDQTTPGPAQAQLAL